MATTVREPGHRKGGTMRRPLGSLVIVAVGLLLGAGLVGAESGAAADPDIAEVTVGAVIAEAQPPVVFLMEKGGKRTLPISVGPTEAQAISLELERVVPARPLTHDLLKTVLEKLQARVRRIVITEMRNRIFYAVIILEQGKGEITIDARPSDAIALALRMKAAMYVARKVLDAQGVEIPPRDREQRTVPL